MLRVPVLPQRVDRQVAEGRHVLGAVAGTDLRDVLGESGVADEVQPVLDGPLRPGELAESLGEAWCEVRSVIA